MTLTPRIVLAMHDRELGAQFAALLEKAKFEVAKCATARELEDIVTERDPAVILLGVLLPDGNGLEICKRFKNDPQKRTIKIVVISTFKRSARFGLEARTRFGADEFLEMPVPPKELIQTIEDLLDVAPAKRAVAPPARHVHSGAPPRPAARPAASKRAAADGRLIERPFEGAAAPPPPEPAAPPDEKPSLSDGWTGASRASREIPLSGRLGSVLLPELLLSLYQRRASGVLAVRAYDEQREILLRDGVPVAIRSNFIPDDALGQLLISQGLTDAITLERLLRRAREEGRRVGDLLVEADVVSPADLAALLRVQAKRKMNSAFRWKDGAYVFTAGAREIADAVDIHQDMLSILLGGVVRHFDLAKLEERLYANKSAVVVRTANSELGPKDLLTSARERAVLELVDGERTLGEIIAESDLNFVRTFQVLYLFLLFGVICFKGGDRFFRIDEAVAHRARTESFATVEDAAEPDAAAETPPGEEHAFPKMLFDLYRSRAKGRIIVGRGDDEEYVYLAGGVPVQTAARRAGPLALGNLLVQRGKLSPEERDKLVAEAQTAHRPFGECALARGVLSPHELFEILLLQLEGRLLALFTRGESELRFEVGVDPPAEAAPMPLNFGRLILRGIEESVPQAEAIARLKKLRDRRPAWVGAPAEAAKLFVEPREARLLNLIDGERTVDDIVRDSRLEEGRAAHVLDTLWQLGLVQMVGL